MERHLQAFRSGQVLAICLAAVLFGAFPAAAAESRSGANGTMTEDEAVRLGEQFGIVVGPVDEAIKKELKMERAEGVVVFEVIGNSRADYAGIKVRAVIKEIDKHEVRTMMDFGRALKRAINECNFTVGTYEPADASEQGVGGLVNFHFVGCARD